MFNRVILLGNLTRDIEMRYTQWGTAIGNSAIATNRKFKNQLGDLTEEVCFIDITFFGKTAQIANQYLSKGKRVLLEGRLKFDQWVDKSENKRSKHSVIVEVMKMVEPKPQEATKYRADSTKEEFSSKQNKDSIKNDIKDDSSNVPEIDIDDDEIPF